MNRTFFHSTNSRRNRMQQLKRPRRLLSIQPISQNPMHHQIRIPSNGRREMRVAFRSQREMPAIVFAVPRLF
jgi:N-glycosylase/DNA lyase